MDRLDEIEREMQEMEDKLPAMQTLELVVGDIWVEAMRFALDTEGAATRCGRRACRRRRVCRMQRRPGKPLTCGGGEISDETIRLAAAVALFGGFMVMQVLYSPNAEPGAPWRLRDDA